MVTSNSMLLVSRTGRPGSGPVGCVSSHGREAGQVRRWWLALLVVAVLVLGAAGGTWAVRRDSAPAASPTPTPAPVPSRTPLLAAATGGDVSPTGLLSALTRSLADPHLGRRVSVAVVGTDGRVLLDRGGARPVTPASTAKLATAVAALAVLPQDLRLRTRVVQGARPGEVVLVGGGDPTLGGRFPATGYPGVAGLRSLAHGLTGVTRVLVDDSLFTGPRLGPGWKPNYVTTGNVAPV